MYFPPSPDALRIVSTAFRRLICCPSRSWGRIEIWKMGSRLGCPSGKGIRMNRRAAAFYWQSTLYLHLLLSAVCALRLSQIMTKWISVHGISVSAVLQRSDVFAAGLILIKVNRRGNLWGFNNGILETQSKSTKESNSFEIKNSHKKDRQRAKSKAMTVTNRIKFNRT